MGRVGIFFWSCEKLRSRPAAGSMYCSREKLWISRNTICPRETRRWGRVAARGRSINYVKA